MLEMHFVDKNANVDSKLHSYLFLLENDKKLVHRQKICLCTNIINFKLILILCL